MFQSENGSPTSCRTAFQPAHRLAARSGSWRQRRYCFDRRAHGRRRGGREYAERDAPCRGRRPRSGCDVGITEAQTARPIQAALASAATFSVGAALPLLIAVVVPPARIIVAVSAGSLICLAVLGALAAHAGGANLLRGAVRVTFWSALALLITATVGRLFGASV